MQPYGNTKIKHNYRNHPYKLLHGLRNWWEDMGTCGKKQARQKSKQHIRNQLRKLL